jgi:hypothetical protein
VREDRGGVGALAAQRLTTQAFCLTLGRAG